MNSTVQIACSVRTIQTTLCGSYLRDEETGDSAALQRLIGIELLPVVSISLWPMSFGHDVAAAFEEPCGIAVPELVKRGVGHFGRSGNFLERPQEVRLADLLDDADFFPRVLTSSLGVYFLKFVDTKSSLSVCYLEYL
jgi:hypothetical protein